MRWMPMLTRDLLVGAACAGLWWLELEAAPDAWGTAVAAGVVTALVGFLAHEWGHLAGALMTGSSVEPNPPWFPLLFRFDVQSNGVREFLAMSRGGYIGSALATAAIAFAVPWDRLSGWVALGLAGVGVLATFVLEVPTHLAVARGEPLPSQGAAYFRPDERRS